MPNNTPLKKQIHFVGFYPRLMASMIDVGIFSVIILLLMPIFSWLTFGSQDPVKELSAIASQSIQGAGSTQQIIENLRHNEQLWQHIREQHIMLKLSIQYGLQSLVFAGGIFAFWKYKAATPGKMLLSMKIADATTYETPTTRQYILRLIGYAISFALLLIGFLWIAADNRKRGLHDRIAGTVVIKA